MSVFGLLRGLLTSSSQPALLNVLTAVRQALTLDASGRLETHATVLSDEGSFRDDFTGTSLTRALTGTVTFTAGSLTVTGSGTSFTTQVQAGDFIKKAADSETLYAEVESVDDDQTITLVSVYGGTTASVAGVVSSWQTVTAASGSITVGSSLVNLTIGTTTGQSTYLVRKGDYLPYTLNENLTVSQRVANQVAFIGFRDQFANPNFRCEVQFTGTDNTKVNFVTSGGPNAADTTTSTVTLTAASTTATSHQYKIDLSGNVACLSIDGAVVATNTLHLPGPYTLLNIYQGVTNTGTATGSTTVAIDSIYWFNPNRVQVDNDFKGEPVPVLATVQPNIVVDAGNSSVANLASGATFTGAWANTLTVTSLYFNFYCDQPCTVYIDQSVDLVTSPITDSYAFNPLKGAIGWPISAASNHWRVRVTNNGSSTSTTLTLNAYQVAMQETLPRSLDGVGNLKVGVYSLADQFGYLLKSDPMGALRTEQPYRLVGASFSGASVDSNYWLTVTSGTGAAVTAGSGLVTLLSTSTGPGYAELTTVKTARFVFAHPHLYRGILRKPNLVVANTAAWWGAYTTARTTIAVGSNGVSLPQATINVASTAANASTGTVAFPSSGTLYITTAAGVQTVTYTGVTGTTFTGCSGGTGAMSTGGLVQFTTPVDGFYFGYSATGVLSVNSINQGVITNSVSSGSFNGDVSAYTLNTAAHAYEIIHFLGSAKFTIDNVTVNTMVPGTVQMSSTYSLQATTTVLNPTGSGAQTQTQIEVWASMILRLGRDTTAPVWRNIRGVNVGVALKTGPGRLRHVAINGSASSSAVSLYDAASATNPIALILIGANNTAPFVQTYDVDFNVGLFVVTAVASTDVTIVYE